MPGECSVERPQRTSGKRLALNICHNRRQVSAKGELLGWPKTSLGSFCTIFRKTPRKFLANPTKLCIQSEGNHLSLLLGPTPSRSRGEERGRKRGSGVKREKEKTCTFYLQCQLLSLWWSPSHRPGHRWAEISVELDEILKC